MTALVCMEELQHSLGSFIRVGSTSECSAVLLASLLPPLLQQTRAAAASSGVEAVEASIVKPFWYHGGVCSREQGGYHSWLQ